MRKVLLLLLAVVMVFGIVACAGSGSGNSPDAGNNPGNSSAPGNSTQPSSPPAGGDSPSSAPDGADKNDWRFWQQFGEDLAAQGKANWKVLYLVSWAAAEYFQDSYNAWVPMFESIGAELVLQGPADYTPEAQLSALESAYASRQYDAIIIYPILPTDWLAIVYEELWETYKVPTILWGFPLTYQCAMYSPISVSDEETGDEFPLTGRLLAAAIIEYVEKNWDYFSKYSGTDGIPVVYAEEDYNPAQNERVTTCRDVLEKDGRFKTLYSFENVDEDQAITYAETVALNFRETEIIVCYVDTLAVLFNNSLMQETGMSPYLGIFGFDGTTAARQIMYEGGLIKGSIMSNHRIAGTILIDMIKIVTPAAKEGIWLRDELNEYFASGQYSIDRPDVDEERFVAVTQFNIRDFYTP